MPAFDPIVAAPDDSLPHEVEEGRREGPWLFRDELRQSDPAAIRKLTAATGLFSPEEITIAGELAEARLAQGLASGYRFLLAEREGGLEGYVCFGPIPLTRAGFDIYWIVVRPCVQRAGLGRHLLQMAEAEIARLGGSVVYVETASREQYARTHAFYRRAGYAEAAHFPDFYAPGDGKIVFVKRLMALAR